MHIDVHIPSAQIDWHVFFVRIMRTDRKLLSANILPFKFGQSDMNIYRRNQIYWWRRRISLENLEKNTILTRITLKTSDRSVARRIALTLDMEFEMVAVKYPTQIASPNPKMIAAVYKEALEYKRDQIINIQNRPPYDTEIHKRYNSAYGKIFSIMSKTAVLPSIKDIRNLSAACPEMDENEIILRCGLN